METSCCGLLFMNIETLVKNVCLLLQYSQDKGYCENLKIGKFIFPVIHVIICHQDDSQVLCILLKSNSFSDTFKTVYGSSYDNQQNFTILPMCIKL